MIKATKTFIGMAGALLAISSCATKEASQKTLSGLDPEKIRSGV